MLDLQNISRIVDGTEYINDMFGPNHGIHLHMGKDAVLERLGTLADAAMVDLYQPLTVIAGGQTETIGYMGESMMGYMVIELERFTLRMDLDNCDGVTIVLRDYLVEDGETFDMEVQWTEMLPVVRWFMGIARGAIYNKDRFLGIC